VDADTLTDTSGRMMTWDSQNRMASCTKGGVTSTYTYGADGLRRSSTASGITTYYVYDGQTMIREMKKSAQTGALFSTATYFQGPRGSEYRRDDTQTELDSQGRQVSVCRWYVYDGLGSVVGEVDPSGSLTSSPKYDVYGAVRANSGAASTRQGFVGGLGHVSDSETGLVYMRARYYDPSNGRFVSQDSAKSGTNWFVYCINNPVNFVDESGDSSSFPFLVILELLDSYGVFKQCEGLKKVVELVLSTQVASELCEYLMEVSKSTQELYAGIRAGEVADVRQRMTACGQLIAAAGAYGAACTMVAYQGLMLCLMGCFDSDSPIDESSAPVAKE